MLSWGKQVKIYYCFISLVISLSESTTKMSKQKILPRPNLTDTFQYTSFSKLLESTYVNRDSHGVLLSQAQFVLQNFKDSLGSPHSEKLHRREAVRNQSKG